MIELSLTSSAFIAKAAIPLKYTCEGINVSPPLSWSRLPSETRSIALILDDPDAAKHNFTHWVVYNLEPDVRELPEDFSSSPGTAMQARNDFGHPKYEGPCPPANEVHRYYFRLYALSTRLPLSDDAMLSEVVDQIRGNIIANTELFGTYASQLAQARR